MRVNREARVMGIHFLDHFHNLMKMTKMYIHNKTSKLTRNFWVHWTQVSNPVSLVSIYTSLILHHPQTHPSETISWVSGLRALLWSPLPGPLLTTVPFYGALGPNSMAYMGFFTWHILWRLGLTMLLITNLMWHLLTEDFSVHTVYTDPAGDRKMQRCPHPNPRNPWIHYFTRQRMFRKHDCINHHKMESLFWIIQ